MKTLILIITSIVVAVLSAVLFGIVGKIIAVGICVFLFILWLIKCFRIIGTKEFPAQAVAVQWRSRAIDVTGPGLYWVWWPIQDVRIFPTHQYQLNFQASNVHSKQEREYKTAEIIVDVGIYFRWPLWNEVYSEGDGRDLLKERTFYVLPADPDDAEELKDFFEQAVLDAVRRTMVTRTHKQCREEKEDIEREIKDYLLKEPGNPFKECGIPEEELDISVISIKFAKEMEFSTPEIEQRKAKGEKAHQQVAIKVLTDAGVPPILAGMFARKGTAEGLSPGEIRDIVITAGVMAVMTKMVGGIDLGELLKTKS